ncbi:MAG: HDOD domain-containing protein [Leptospirales bacterium]|nr:HDOD domain-containing protein [Leptospirales bacterium]
MELREYVALTGALKSSQPVRLPISVLASTQQNLAVGLLANALADIGAAHLQPAINLAVQELLNNAELALHFEDFLSSSGRQADDPEGRSAFAGEWKEKSAALRAALRKKPPRIQLELKIENGELFVAVHGLGALYPFQEERIRQRLQAAAAADSLQSLEKMNWKTEQGGGLGVAVAAIALRRAGGELQFHKSAEGVRFQFKVAPARAAEERVDPGVLLELEAIPAFPEHIRKLRELCDSPVSSLKQVADFLNREPALASGIIRLANSGGFAGGNIIDLHEAVKIVGLRNISQLLLQVGALEVLTARYGGNEELIEHPVRVASFARSLAKRNKRAALADQAYVGGLLHDLGKLVLYAATRNRPGYDFLSHHRSRNSVVEIEELAWGVGHARVGAMLAAKWNFPAPLIAAIERHHAPLATADAHRDLCDMVYLANAMADSLDGQLDFYCLDPGVLERFNLTSEEAFLMLSSALDSEASR